MDFLVFEKESRHADVRCGIGYFRCDDDTCILSVYKFDHENDCFDGSDESYCEPAQTLNEDTSISDKMILPCQLDCNCSLSKAHLFIFIRSICDGIYSDTILVEENNICQTYDLRRINIGAMQVNAHSIKPLGLKFYKSKLLSLLYEKEYHYNIQQADLMAFDDKHNMKSPRKYNCFDNCAIQYITEKCEINIHRKSVGFIGDICRDILCPGMFKCHMYYCIPIASVCDGQSDCLHNDDERFCDSMVCPGSLKCRDENRCVSSDSICDGIPDCLYTFDDELLCDNCPTGCKCQVYVMVCTESVASTNLGMNYAKAIIIKTGWTGFWSRLYKQDIYYIWTFPLVHLLI